MTETHGYALETDGHVHAVIYDPITGFGDSTIAQGHYHSMHDFKLEIDDKDLHTHEFVLASKLDDDQKTEVDALIALDEKDKTREEKIESCVLKLKAKGTEKSKAFAICTAAQNKKGKDEIDVGPGAGMGPGGQCVCPKCGAKTAHKRGTPCVDVKCPKCGAKMTRASS